MATYRGVILDWGGVLTAPIGDTARVWLDAEQIDRDSYSAVMRSWVVAAYDGGDDNPVHALERGECTTEEFERLLAARIVRTDGAPVAPDNLLARMFAATVLSEPMHDLVRAVRAAGLRTGLLSNSWGVGDYPRHLFPGMFDAVVISAEVGMRKPEERIFRHATDLLGVAPAECVFIDDFEANVAAAKALGMAAVLHREPSETVAALASLLSVPLG